MGNRTAKFVSALFASIVAGAPLAAVSQNAAEPADDCLASPKGAAPQGQHWYYRIERGSKRQCWYLREEGAPVAQTAPANAPKAESSAARSVQDAHAELASPQAAPAQALPAQAAPAQAPTAPNAAVAPRAPQRPAAAADTTIRPPAPASIWPDPASVSTVPQVAPASEPADTAVDASPSAQPAAPAPMPAAAAEAPAPKPTGSLQTLMLVIGGALALAGITGSLILRFAGARVRVQARTGARRRADWSRWDQAMETGRAPWAQAPRDLDSRAERPRAIDQAPETVAEPAAAPIMAPQAAAAPLRARNPVDIDALAQEIERLAKEARDAADAAPPFEPAAEPVAAMPEPAAADADIDFLGMLERLAQEGPRLDPRLDPRVDSRLDPKFGPMPDHAIAGAGPGDFVQSRQGRSGARA